MVQRILATLAYDINGIVGADHGCPKRKGGLCCRGGCKRGDSHSARASCRSPGSVVSVLSDRCGGICSGSPSSRTSGPTRPADRDGPICVHPTSQFARTFRLQSFRRITSCDVCRSKVRSATIRVNREFSPSSCFSQRISLGSRLPYFFLGKVGRLPDTCVATDLGNRRAFLALLQDKRLLRLRELRCFHRSQLLFHPENARRKLQL